MKKLKEIMTNVKTATSIDEQIKKLRDFGMEIGLTQVSKAQDALLDIGYYRLGCYWFPFEETPPIGKGHSHKFKEGTIFDYAIKLYYFDFDLRNILLRYISRIEVNFRTTVVYLVSNKYKKIPCWYKDNNVVDSSLLKSRTYKNVLKNIRQEPLINRHYTKYKTDAPAWKELEFMPFGTIINLYDNLRDQHLRCDIAKVYGITNPSNFSNYINTVRHLRNCCAHGKVLFDLRLPKAISKGPLGDLKVRRTMLSGAYCVFRYFLQKISENRVIEMETRLKEAYSCIPYQSVKDIILKTSGFTEEDVL